MAGLTLLPVPWYWPSVWEYSAMPPVYLLSRYAILWDLLAEIFLCAVQSLPWQELSVYRFSPVLSRNTALKRPCSFADVRLA